MIDEAGSQRQVPLRLLAGRAHYEQVVRRVMHARVSVWIATANLKGLMVEGDGIGRRRSWQSIMEVFDCLLQAGVEVRILHSGFPSRGFRDEFDRHPRLVRGELQMRRCPRVHLKAVIVDGEDLYLGSANWTGAGLGAKAGRRRNFELGIWTRDELMLDEVQALFDHLWRGGECAACGRRDVCEEPLA